MKKYENLLSTLDCTQDELPLSQRMAAEADFHCFYEYF